MLPKERYSPLPFFRYGESFSVQLAPLPAIFPSSAVLLWLWKMKNHFPKLSIFEWDAEHWRSRIHAWYHPLNVQNFPLFISSARTLRRRKTGNPKLSIVYLLYMFCCLFRFFWVKVIEYRFMVYAYSRQTTKAINNCVPSSPSPHPPPPPHHFRVVSQVVLFFTGM